MNIRAGALAVLVGLCAVSANVTGKAQKGSLQRQVREIGGKVEKSVAPIMFWPKDFPKEQAGVVGSAFFVSEKGHFLTAAHVLSSNPPESGSLSINILQKAPSGGAGMRFDVLERDDEHDLALCKAIGFEALWKSRQMPPTKGLPVFDLGILELEPNTPPTGTFVLVAGFPLGSWNPTLQFGIISATETLNPNVEGVPAGGRNLIQVGIAVNKGNSGSPVIDIESGKVIGIVVQALPAPLFSPMQNLPLGQSSGISLAAPGKWAIALLERHSVGATLRH